MKMTIEQIVCDTILQEPMTITVDDKQYSIAPPVASTLIEASKYISRIPEIPISGDDLKSALSYACDCEFAADVVAILMLGRKNLRTEKTIKKRSLFGLINRSETVVVDNQKQLAETLLDELSWKQISNLGNMILSKMDVGFFWGLQLPS